MPRAEFTMLLKKKWPVWLALGILFLFSLFLGGRELWRWHSINTEYQAVKNKVGLYQQQSEAMQNEINNLARPEVLEKEARAKLNLKREGESVLVVVGGDNFPEEDFLKAQARGLFDNSSGIWFNIKNWLNYFNIKK